MCILAYHMVDPRHYFGATRVTASAFEKQIRMIQELGMPVQTLHDYLDSMPNKRGIALTFDDGFQSVFQYAFPVLERYNMKATVFVISAYAGQYNLWDVTFGRRARLMDWEELRKLVKAGWEVGSHSLTHRDIRLLSMDQRMRELVFSRRIIEQQLGRCSQVISFPFGNTDESVIHDCRRAGYSRGVVLSPLSGDLDPAFNIARHGVYLFDSLQSVRQKLTGENKHMIYAVQRVIGWCSNATVAVKQKEWQIH